MNRLEEYQKTSDTLLKFPNGEKLYKESALFHQVVQMIVKTGDPYIVIEQLIAANEAIQKSFEQYMHRDPYPSTPFNG